MKTGFTRIKTVICTAALLATMGCGGESSIPAPKASTTEAKVTGKVTANGKAVAKGRVIFSPPGPPFVERFAEIRPDGGYEVTTFIGNNSISVSGTGIPAKAGTYETTHFDVKEGTNTRDLMLPLTDN